MLFVPKGKAVPMYGSGRCVRHATAKRPQEQERETVVMEEMKGGGEPKRIVHSKPAMDKVIQKLSAMKQIKRKKIVFTP